MLPGLPSGPRAPPSIHFPDRARRTAKSVTGPLRTGEFISPALRTVRLILRLPLWLKKLQATFLRWFSRPRGRNDAWASLIEAFHPKSALDERKLVVARETYKAAWHAAWKREGLDFVLTVPHALPAVPRDPRASDRATLVSADYAFLFNIVRDLRPRAFYRRYAFRLPRLTCVSCFPGILARLRRRGPARGIRRQDEGQLCAGL